MKIKFLGFDNNSQLKRKLIAFKITEKHPLVINKVLHKSFKNIEEWILLPNEFEFKENEIHSNQRYCGLFIDKEIKPIPKTIVAFLKNKKPQKNILVALGSVHEIQSRNKSKEFLKKIEKVASNDPKKNYLIVTGDKYFSEFQHTYTNVFFVKEIPQFTILGLIDLFITHGGPSSIMESVYQLCPMLVFPLNNVFDQNGNAARVEYHKLGKMMHINDAEIKIAKAISEIFENHDQYIKNITQMKEKINVPKKLSLIDI